MRRLLIKYLYMLKSNSMLIYIPDVFQLNQVSTKNLFKQVVESLDSLWNCTISPFGVYNSSQNKGSAWIPTNKILDSIFTDERCQ